MSFFENDHEEFHELIQQQNISTQNSLATRNGPEMAMFLSQATILPEKIVNDIVDQVEKTILDKTVQRKLPHHKIVRTFYLQDLFLKQLYLSHDLPMSKCPEDHEPRLKGKDFWRSMDIPFQSRVEFDSE